MANPSGFGCHAKPYVGPTSDPAGSDTNRVNFVAQTPTAYVHMHPIGYTQNFGPFDGGCNMNSTQVLPPAIHSTVTWLVCLLVQPTSHWPPCHTLTRPTTTNSDGHAPIPQPETYGDMIVTAPSRRANLHNEQPRRGRASTPRRHNTPKRHVTPPRPVVIRAEAPPAPAPAAPTHPWLTPETNWEEDPWTRAEREHAEQQEARAKAKAPPPPAPYSAQEPPAGPPVTPSINPPRQHRVEQTPITRAFETLRQTAGSSVQSIPALVFPHHHQLQLPLSSHRWLHQPTSTSWHSHGTWSVDFRLHLLHQESQTPYWVHGLKDHRSNLPASCHQHTCMACRPSYEKTAASNWTVSSWPSSHPCLRNHYPVSIGTWGTIIQGNMTPQVPGHQHFRSPSADPHGLRNTNRRRLSTQVLVAPTSPARQECGTRTLRQ